MDFENFFDDKLSKLKQQGNYRYFAELARQSGKFPYAQLYRDMQEHSTIKIWCSNDYLCLGQHPKIIETMHRAIDISGAGAGGTRNISGTHHYHVLLEQALADFHNKESALIFTSGYVANLTSLSTLGRNIPDVIFYSDAGNHNSLIEGIRSSSADKRIFRHNDIKHLEELIKADDAARPKIIVAESLYSMHGTIAPLADIVTVARKHNAMLFLDEVHAVGLYGNKGGGIAQQEGLEHEIDILQGTMGKAFGAIGGYVTGSAKMVDFIRSFGYGFIFTTSLPPAICAAVIEALKIVQQDEMLRARLHKNSQSFKAHVRKANIPIGGDDNAHIVPVLIGDSHLCREIAEELLLQHHIYVQPINYPTVIRGEERLRFTPNPLHSEDDIMEVTAILYDIFAKNNILAKAL